jgi:hypothetical protein
MEAGGARLASRLNEMNQTCSFVKAGEKFKSEQVVISSIHLPDDFETLLVQVMDESADPLLASYVMVSGYDEEAEVSSNPSWQ